MSPRGGGRCPPALLALLLGLAGSRGSLECRDGAASLAVTAGASLCLAPEEPPREWTEIRWKLKISSGVWQRILTVKRDKIVSYPNGSFYGREKFQRENLSLCISPVHRNESGLYGAELENVMGISSWCFRVSVWEPIPPPELRSQILQRDRGRCRLALLCASPGNVSYSWACAGEPAGEIPGEPPGQIPEQIPEQIPGQMPGQIPGQIPEQIPGQVPEEIPGQIPGQIPGIPSRLLRTLPEGAEPQICLCNVSNPAGWSAARARLTCPEGLGRWMLLAVAAAAGLSLLLLLGGCCCCWGTRRRRRRRNSREGTPGTPPEQALTIYAEVGEKKPRQDAAGSGEATPEGATVYAVVAPRTLEHPRHREEPGNLTIYSTVQIDRRPSSIKRKRLERSLVSTAYLEDNGGYRRLGFPNPAGHQRP